MSQSPKKRKAAPKGQAPQGRKQTQPKMNKRPKRRNPRGTGAKRATEIIISLVLIGLFAYKGYQIYSDITPISQETALPSGEYTEMEEETEPETPLFDNIEVDNETVYSGDLILVNADYEYDEQNADQIVSIYDKKSDNYYVSGSDTSLRIQAIEAFNDLADDFYIATGIDDLIIISGYRTTEQQQSLYDADLESTGEDYSTRVALPKHSEHETGLAFDLSLYDGGVMYDYDGTGDYEWINENCARYGFILRYTEEKVDTTQIQSEPWHYRYVGEPHATYITENDMCLEEYIAKLSNYTAENPLEVVNWDGEIYNVYHVAADSTANSTYVSVPTGCEYTIEGNNVDGFIVTVDTGEIQEFTEEETESESETTADSVEETETAVEE